MKRFGSGSLLIAGALLVLAADGLILTSAAGNRRGPAATFTLTERELALPLYQEEDQTGLQLTLTPASRPPALFARTAWFRNERLPQMEHSWLDRAKLGSLGFAVDLDPADPQAADYYREALPRRVILVLEYDGEAWKRWLEGQENRQLRDETTAGTAQALLTADRTMRSRLMLVDAGTDADALRRRYAGSGRHLVLPGVIGIERIQHKERGWILSPSPRILVSQIHVSAPFRSTLAPFLSRIPPEDFARRLRASAAWPEPVPPRYRATLAVGRNHEAWLVKVEKN